MNIDKLLYEPAPAIDPTFQEQFDAIVPANPSGTGRMLRYSWGCDRTEIVAGHTIRRYGDLDNDPAKYIGRCRWILEGYQSPDVYNRKEWEADKHLLGPWPENGVWDFVEYHVGEEDKYLPLDNSALKRARSWSFWKSKGFKRSIEQLMEQRMIRYALQQQREQEARRRVAEEFGEAVVDLFENDTNPVTTIGSKSYRASAGGILVKE